MPADLYIVVLKILNNYLCIWHCTIWIVSNYSYLQIINQQIRFERNAISGIGYKTLNYFVIVLYYFCYHGNSPNAFSIHFIPQYHFLSQRYLKLTDGSLHFSVPSMTGSIKLNLQHFRFCLFGCSLWMFIFSILPICSLQYLIKHDNFH
jgi:hypothetical protein